MDNLLIKYKNNIGINSVRLRKIWFKNHGFMKEYNQIFILTQRINVNSISERLYCIMNDIVEDIGICPYCNINRCKYKGYTVGYLRHCGSNKCINNDRLTHLNEDGLTCYQSTGKIVSIKQKEIMSNGKTRASNNTTKGHNKHRHLLIDGIPFLNYVANKGVTTKKSIKCDNGLTISKNAALKASETMKKTIIEGQNLHEIRVAKGNQTKLNTIVDGLNGFERAFKNGAGTTPIKYYSKDNDLYYQGNLEKCFLDLMSKHNLLDKISRCPHFIYVNDNKRHYYHPDFIINNIIIEIKSDWTYGKYDDIIRKKNHLKFMSVLNENKTLIILLDMKYFIIFTKSFEHQNLYDLENQPIENLINYLNI